jgi:membrane protease YdiL (CAAX protease family)
MEAEQRQDPFWSYADLLVFLGLAVPSFVLGIALVRGFLLLAPTLRPGRAIELFAGQFAGYALWFACLALLFRTRYNRRLWEALNLRLPAGLAIPAFFFGVLLAIAVAVIGALLRTPPTDSTLLELMRDRTSIIVVAFFAVTLGPLCEELVFRGFLLPLLVRSLGPGPGILLTALPFALLHGPQYHWSWQHLVLLTAVGCAFGWTRHKTGSTAVPTIMHAGYNASFMAAFIISKKEYF